MTQKEKYKYQKKRCFELEKENIELKEKYEKMRFSFLKFILLFITYSDCPSDGVRKDLRKEAVKQGKILSDEITQSQPNKSN